MESSEQRKLFVGGLPRETNEDTLREYFSKNGTVEQALVMRYKVTGIGRGFGFVTFADFSMADEALRHNNHVILGRKVDLKQANPKDKGLEQSNGYCSNCNGNIEFSTKKIFVGGLPPDLTEEEFKRYFDKFGTVTDAVVMYDKESCRPRGFGFITYDSEDVVDNVLKNRYHELKNKKVEVKRAEPKDKNDKNIHHYESKNGNDKYVDFYDCYNSGLGLGFGGGFSYGYNTFSHYCYPAAFQTTVYYHSPCVFVPPRGGSGSRSNLNGSSSSSLPSHASLTSENQAVHNNYVFYTPFGVCLNGMNGWTSEDVDLNNRNGSCEQMEDNSNGDHNSGIVEVPTTTKLPQIDDLSSLKISAVEHQGGDIGDLLSLKGNIAENQRAEITIQEAVLPSTKSEQNGDS